MHSPKNNDMKAVVLTEYNKVEYYENVIAIDASKVNPVRGCIQSVCGGGTVCVLGLGNEPAPIVFKELIWKEAKIVSSRVSHGEFAEAIEHLKKGRFKPEALISQILHGSQAQCGFEILDKNPAENIKILLDFRSSSIN